MSDKDANFDGKYKLERKLMSGSYGTVYVGVNVKTSVKFAIKIVDRR
jgi:serine/threonine protein kinase